MVTPRRGSERTTIRRTSSTASQGHLTNGRRGWGSTIFCGFLGGETDQWTPLLYENNRQVLPWVGKPGYNLITDMADQAIKYMRELKAQAPDSP
jgi:arylsulfatase A-like enzyme